MTRRNLFKIAFHLDNLMIPVSIVFLYMAFLSIRDFGLKIADLDQYAGTYSSCDSTVIKVKDKPLFKQITQRLDLKMENSPYNFTIQTTEDFGYLTSQIKVGDSLIIWTKTKQSDIKLGKSISINHLIANNKTLVDFDKTFAVTPGLIALCLLSGFGFLIWFYLRTKKRLYKIGVIAY